MLFVCVVTANDMQKAKKRLSELRRSGSTKKIHDDGDSDRPSPVVEGDHGLLLDALYYNNNNNDYMDAMDLTLALRSASTVSPTSSSSTLTASPMCITPKGSHVDVPVLEAATLDLSSLSSPIKESASPTSLSPKIYDGPAIIKYVEDGYLVNYTKEPINRENAPFCFKCDTVFPSTGMASVSDMLVVTGSRYSKSDDCDLLIYREIFVCASCHPVIVSTRENDPFALIDISYKARMLFREYRS